MIICIIFFMITIVNGKGFYKLLLLNTT